MYCHMQDASAADVLPVDIIYVLHEADCQVFCYCRAPIQSEKLVPSAKLTTVHIPLRPTEAVLAPLPGKRDALPNNRVIHSLLLTYKLSVTEGGKHTITLPPLNRCYIVVMF